MLKYTPMFDCFQRQTNCTVGVLQQAVGFRKVRSWVHFCSCSKPMTLSSVFIAERRYPPGVDDFPGSNWEIKVNKN